MRMSALVDRSTQDKRGTALCCPVCGNPALHIQRSQTLVSGPGFAAWDGDGDAAVIVLACENAPDHVCGVVIGEHKGSATMKLVTLAELETGDRRDGVYQVIANCAAAYAERYGRECDEISQEAADDRTRPARHAASARTNISPVRAGPAN